MSILIKGAEMPSKGNWIAVFIYPNGTCIFPQRQGGYTNIEGVKAVEIPPHGRLIDADKLIENIPVTQNDGSMSCRNCDLLDDVAVEEFIDNAPTVIESEEGEGE